MAKTQGKQEPVEEESLGDTEWVGGFSGMRLSVMRGPLLSVPMDQQSYIRLLIDAGTFHETSGGEALGNSQGPETPMEDAKMQKPLIRLGRYPRRFRRKLETLVSLV